MEKIKFQNRLINEKSPYLLNHAANPVNWYPWGKEALSKAEEEDKPIFLSIGYDACHWCHVMARESFSDKEVGDLLNESFISIKVDREERPDIDHIYMEVCNMLTGAGGWPLNLFLTPEGKPFFAGTYFPKDQKGEMLGFTDLIERVAEAWENERDKIYEVADKITEYLNQKTKNESQMTPDEAVRTAAEALIASFDEENGGFGPAPKFPMPLTIMFLQKYGEKSGDEMAKAAAERTLRAIYGGGIHDHIGGGYCRYSVDETWQVPHFEKMLYDNALLAMAFLEAGGRYIDAAEEIFEFVKREMTSPEGAFYSAISAESEEGEGAFYLWKPRQVEKVLGDKAEDFCRAYNIKSRGNFAGGSIPYTDGRQKVGFKTAIEKLREEREKRPKPPIDDKILLGQNALMIAALARGGKVTGKGEYIRAAERAVEFIEKNLVTKEGRLLSRWRDGDAAFRAYAHDYAYYIWALISLYSATKKEDYLERARELWKDVLTLFWDNRGGGAFIYGKDSERLIARPKDFYDGAQPSANSVFAACLSELYGLTGEDDYKAWYEEVLEAFEKEAVGYPYSSPFLLYTVLNE